MPILNGVEILEEKLGERKERVSAGAWHDNKKRLPAAEPGRKHFCRWAESKAEAWASTSKNNVDLHKLVCQAIEDIEKKSHTRRNQTRCPYCFCRLTATAGTAATAEDDGEGGRAKRKTADAKPAQKGASKKSCKRTYPFKMTRTPFCTLTATPKK